MSVKKKKKSEKKKKTTEKISLNFLSKVIPQDARNSAAKKCNLILPAPSWLKAI